MSEYSHLEPREIRHALGTIRDLIDQNEEREVIVDIVGSDYTVSVEYANALIDTVYGLMDMGLDLYKIL